MSKKMKKVKDWFTSGNSKKQASEDVAVLTQKSISHHEETNPIQPLIQSDHHNVEEITTIGAAIRTGQLPKELVVHIATFMTACDISQFSCNRHLLKMFFNMSFEVFEPVNFDEETESFPTSFKMQEGEEFSMVQQMVWKPLVLLYFPKFHRDLNVKNWYHVLKRRTKHLARRHPQMLPLKRSTILRMDDTPFVENCSFIYRCPMVFENLPVQSAGVRYCDACQSKVYQVYTADDMKKHSEEGHCIFFEMPPTQIPPPHLFRLMGGPPPPMNQPKPPPQNIPPGSVPPLPQNVPLPVNLVPSHRPVYQLQSNPIPGPPLSLPPTSSSALPQMAPKKK